MSRIKTPTAAQAAAAQLDRMSDRLRAARDHYYRSAGGEPGAIDRAHAEYVRIDAEIHERVMRLRGAGY